MGCECIARPTIDPFPVTRTSLCGSVGSAEPVIEDQSAINARAGASMKGPKASRPASWVAAAALTLLLSGCARDAIFVKADDSNVRVDRVGPASDPAKQRGQPATDRRNILILTSGGADGAFGAGVLTAWSVSGRRPTFDIVAGTAARQSGWD